VYHVICVVVPGVARYVDLSSQDVVLHAAYLGQGVGDDGLGVVGCEPLYGLWNSNTCYIRFCARTRTTTTPRNGVSRRKRNPRRVDTISGSQFCVETSGVCENICYAEGPRMIIYFVLQIQKC
jgi:hypothetical protein